MFVCTNTLPQLLPPISGCPQLATAWSQRIQEKETKRELMRPDQVAQCPIAPTSRARLPSTLPLCADTLPPPCLSCPCRHHHPRTVRRTVPTPHQEQLGENACAESCPRQTPRRVVRLAHIPTCTPDHLRPRQRCAGAHPPACKFRWPRAASFAPLRCVGARTPVPRASAHAGPSGRQDPAYRRALFRSSIPAPFLRARVCARSRTPP